MPDTLTTTQTYLQAATEAARWLRSAARDTDQGRLWLADPAHPETTGAAPPPIGVYSGSAGVILFFIQLAGVTGDDGYLEDVRRGAEYLMATWQDLRDAPPRFGIEGMNLTFYQGLAGVAFALAEAWRATDEPRYRAAARAIAGDIVRQARPVGAGLALTDLPALMADGSIVLLLLWAANVLDQPDYRQAATRAGERILELGQADPRGGLRWRAFPLERFGAPEGAHAPNFELGTAGVAYALARLYEETGDRRFLDAAEAGAAHVTALATLQDDAALLLYREPDEPNLYYLGYCHGPTGTARLFYQLHQVTRDPAYLDWTERFARGITRSGIPEKQAPGLWYVVCQCCGTAGVADLFTHLWRATGKPEHLAFARRIADQLVSQASNLDGTGNRWYQAWTRVKPWEVTAETGYMIGAAGVGDALLHLLQAEQRSARPILFPDNPFDGAWAG